MKKAKPKVKFGFAFLIIKFAKFPFVLPKT